MRLGISIATYERGDRLETLLDSIEIQYKKSRLAEEVTVLVTDDASSKNGVDRVQAIVAGKQIGRAHV